jgi:diguanylate cyclase (GGDEF)-like protein/PAS domain S-box-containing protein
VTDQPQDRVVAAVLDGSADAGFVRSGLIEAMSRAGKLDLQQLKVLNPNTSRSNFPFAASTRFYPEWPFAAMTHVEHDLARQVAAALLAIPHGSKLAESMRIHGFTIPGDYRNIDHLLRALRMPPFDEVPFVTLQDIWENWKSLITNALILLGMLLILALFYLFYRNRHLVQIQRELQDYIAENQKLKLAVEQSPVSIAITDLQSRVIYTNRAFTKNTGYRPEEIHGKKMNIFKSSNTPPELFQQLWTTLLDGKSWHGEMVSIYKDGKERDEELVVSPINDAAGNTFAYLTIKQDITERKRSEAHIHQLAYYDPLTGLANRALLSDTLTTQLQPHQRHLLSNMLVLINIDRFKVFNDARGHVFGDALLHALGQRLHSLVENKNALIVARISADEYAILLSCDAMRETPDVSKIMSIADAIHNCVAQPFLINDEQLTISVSVGMVTFNNAGGLSADEVLQRADTALHHVRSAGGNQSALYEPSMRDDISDQFLLDTELREAIKNESLELYLQPQFDAGGEIYGAEVLVRWPHPERGMVPPSLFIPMAEKSDLIVDLSKYVFQKSFQLLAESQRQGCPLHIAINVSPRHCRKSNFVEWIVDLVEETGVDLTYLTLEITEGLFIGNLEMVSQRMKLLHAMGIRFAIDDFGTGYSSLSYLKQLPIHELKIDKSFIQDAPYNSNAAALVDAILAVARHMDLVVIAEGVETQEQHDYIKSHGDVIEQGFLLGRPQAGEEWLGRWIASQKLQASTRDLSQA